ETASAETARNEIEAEREGRPVAGRMGTSSSGNARRTRKVRAALLVRRSWACKMSDAAGRVRRSVSGGRVTLCADAGAGPMAMADRPREFAICIRGVAVRTARAGATPRTCAWCGGYDRCKPLRWAMVALGEGK